MEKKSEKISLLKNKIEASELDDKSIVFLSKMTDELSKFQDSVTEEILTKHPTTYFSLPDKLRTLEQGRITFQAKIQKRQSICSVIRNNETVIKEAMENFGIFLKEFEATAPNVAGYRDRVLENLNANDEFTTVLEESLSGNLGGDVMQKLLELIRTSIEQTNEDKAYFLKKLKTMNDIAEALGEFQENMHEIFDDTDDEDKGNESSNKGMLGYANIKLKTAATSLQYSLDVIGKVVKEEEERDKRRERGSFYTMFENFDQKSNQLFNILSTVMKGMKEMKSSTTRNIL